MPNGATKNWIRLCAVIDGFRSRYQSWPSRICLDPIIHEDIKRLFTEKSLEKLTDKIKLIPMNDATVIAEDEQGRTYDYGKDGFSSSKPDIRAKEWLGVEPNTPWADD